MLIGIPRESWPGERRVAATPQTVARLKKRGIQLVVEAGAGEGASTLDSAYAEAGATIVDAADLYARADVAGLAPMAAERSLGAIVTAFDTRTTVREQIESRGATFLKFEFAGESGEGQGGYAKQMSEAYLEAEQVFIAQEAKRSDIIIT